MSTTKSEDHVMYTPEAAAEYLGVSINTLKNWRGSGEGPKYVRLAKTRIRYRKAALASFLASREFQSTSEEKAPPAPSSSPSTEGDEDAT